MAPERQEDADTRKQTSVPSGGFDLDRRRDALGEKLQSMRGQNKAEREPASATSGYGQAMKLSSEFIAGVLVGIGLGWVIDEWAGTRPWGLVICLILGFCAGILNVLRSMGVVVEEGLKPSRKDGDKPDVN